MGEKSYVSENNHTQFQVVGKQRDNFLMNKLGQDRTALRINEDNPEAQLLSELNEKTETKQEKSFGGKSGSSGRLVDQNDANIIPFSEFMKDKVKYSTRAPTKIPGISKTTKEERSNPRPQVQKQKARSPKIKKFRTNEHIHQSLKNQQQDLSASMKSNKGNYLNSLKNKFSPVAEISL